MAPPELTARIAAAQRAVLAQTDLLHREFGRVRCQTRHCERTTRTRHQKRRKACGNSFRVLLHGSTGAIQYGFPGAK